MLREILTVSGRPGLSKLVARGNNCIIVETVDADHKRYPIQGTDKVVSLGDISIFTDDGEMRLREVFQKFDEKCGGKAVDIDIRKASNAELNSFLADVVPDYDRDRVYPSHIKKMIGWYNILVANELNDFSDEKEQQPEENASEDAPKGE